MASYYNGTSKYKAVFIFNYVFTDCQNFKTINLSNKILHWCCEMRECLVEKIGGEIM